MGWSLLTSLTADKIITMGVFYVVGYVYYFARWKYLKDRQGIDIIQNAKSPIPQWEVLNAPLTQDELAKIKVKA